MWCQEYFPRASLSVHSPYDTLSYVEEESAVDSRKVIRSRRSPKNTLFPYFSYFNLEKRIQVHEESLILQFNKI